MAQPAVRIEGSTLRLGSRLIWRDLALSLAGGQFLTVIGGWSCRLLLTSRPHRCEGEAFPFAVTEYRRYTDTSGPGAHELRTVTNPDNSQLFFQYDSQGRLAGYHRSSGAQAVTYAYTSDGGLTVTDALGNATTYFLDDQGGVGLIRDALGRTVQFSSDAAGNLSQVSIAGGGAVSFGSSSTGPATTPPTTAATAPAKKNSFVLTGRSYGRGSSNPRKLFSPS